MTDLKPDPCPPTPGSTLPLSRNLPKLYAFSFLKMTLFPMAVITLFWKDEIGLSLAEILLLQGIFSVATLLLEYPSGYLADRLGYRKTLHLASLLGVAGWGVYLGAQNFAGVLVAEILLGASCAFISGADSALLFETLRERNETHDYSRCEGRMSFFAQSGEAAGALLAGVMYAAWPLLPFVLQVGVWLLALPLTRSLAEPSREAARAGVSHLAEAAATVRFALGGSPRLRWALLLSVGLGLASFYPVWLIQPYMQQQGVPLGWFGPIWAGANLTVALFSLTSHRFRFHLGEGGMPLLFLALVVGGYFGLALTGGLWAFLFYYLLTAMRGLAGPLLRNRILQGAPSGTRASILSLKSLLFRLLFVATGPAVGRLADTSGLETAFLVLGLGLLLLLLPLTWIYRRTLGAGDEPGGI